MKTLNAFALFFVLTALPVSAELVTDPETGLRTGTITVFDKTYGIGPGVNLEGANLRDADLSYVNLNGAFLRDAYFASADLTGADLSGADLSDSRFTGAILRGAILRGAILRGAGFVSVDLTGADLRDADFTAADLERADFTAADLERADLTGADLGQGHTDAVFTDARLPDIAFSSNSVFGLNGLKIVNLQTELAEKDAKIISLEDRMTALEAQVALLANAGAIQQLQEQIAELSQRPTLEEVRDARAGSVVLTADRENNEVTLNLRVEETDDLKQGNWTIAEGGDLKLTLALAGDKRFMRIALGE